VTSAYVLFPSPQSTVAAIEPAAVVRIREERPDPRAVGPEHVHRGRRLAARGRHDVAEAAAGDVADRDADVPGCGGAVGLEAAALFVVRNGKIVLWQQAAVPAQPPTA
jgi:hypothetical protein